MEHRTYVMLDPSTDQVLAECSGPASDGRCPVTEEPPYICAGLQVINVGDGSGDAVSLTVTEMEPGRCPLGLAQELHEDR